MRVASSQGLPAGCISIHRRAACCLTTPLAATGQHSCLTLQPAPPAPNEQDLIDCDRLSTNNPAAMLAAYGVEACRATIVKEVCSCLRMCLMMCTSAAFAGVPQDIPHVAASQHDCPARWRLPSCA